MASKQSSDDKKNKSQSSVEQKLKPKTSSWTSKPALYLFSVIILGIIVVSFVGGPIVGQMAGPSQSVVFGRYRGEPIELGQDTHFQNQLAQLSRQMGNPQGTAEMYQLYRTAFERTLLQKAILMEAEDSGMTVSSDRVNNQLVQLPQFQEAGEFSRQSLQDTSQQELMNLRSTVRENLIQDRYINDIIGGFEYSSNEIEFFANQGAVERRFNVAQFALENVPDSVPADFVSENSQLFTSAELSVINAGPELEQAEEVRQMLVEGDDTFENLAREFSIDRETAEDGGTLGRVFRYELEQRILEPEDIDAVFETPEGEISPIVDTERGYAVYRIDSGSTEPDVEDDDTLEAVLGYMEEFERGRLEDYMFEQAEEFAIEVRDGGNFTDTAGEYTAEIAETAFFPINYGNQPHLPSIQTLDGDTLNNAASEESFFRAAFSVELGDITEPIVLDDYVMVLEALEQREPEAEDTDRIASIVPRLYQQYQSREVERSLLDSSVIEDNFNEAFARSFLQPQQESQEQAAAPQ